MDWSDASNISLHGTTGLSGSMNHMMTVIFADVWATKIAHMILSFLGHPSG